MKLTNVLRLLSASLLFAVSLMGAVAAPLSPQEALTRVTDAQKGLNMTRGTDYQLAYTETAGDDNVLYVFNNGADGFVIASADDRLPALLGYSDSGSFAPDNLPPQLRGWLKEYANEASYLFRHESEYASTTGIGVTATRATTLTTRAARTDIPALLSTKWNQSDPYNLDCPSDEGGKCVTGCVATAMAQVIKYHAYPERGTGTHDYLWNGQTLSFDYGNTVFDYGNMLDSYDNSATETQRQAVASLLYACGVGVDMGYTSKESGAFDTYIPYALKTYFNYDPGVRLLKKIFYSNEEWEDLVYNEIAEGRPVIYSGQATEGGHEFVCDGYTDGYFHINWGWGGYCDGMYLLSALNPDGQGIGGFEGGYNSDQGMVCGVEPIKGSPSDAWYPIYVSNGLSVRLVYQTTVAISCNIYNYSPAPVEVELFLKAVSESGEDTYVGEGKLVSFNGANGGNISGYSAITLNIPTGVPAGTYKAYIMMKTPEGNVQDVLVPQTGADYLNMTVESDGKVDFTNGEAAQKAKIWVEKFAPEGTVQTNESVKLKFLIKNIGDVEYSGLFLGNVYNHNTEDIADQLRVNISISANEDFDGYITHVFTMEDGEYDVIFYDMYGDQISDTFTLWVGAAPEVVATGVTLDKTEATLVEGETLTLAATIDPENATDRSITWSSSDEEVAVVDNGEVTALSPGTATITAETANGLKATCEITVKAKVIEATEITLDKTEATLVEGDSMILTATVSPENATDRSITWSSSDEEVAVVDNGEVTALSPGTATITAETANGLKATCEITVKAKVILATSISLDKESIEAEEGTTVQLTVTVLPDETTDKSVTWTTSDANIATVDEKGLVKIIGVGSATIIATTNDGSDLSASCRIYGLSGIAAIFAENGSVDVYTTGGLVVRLNADAEFMANLRPGIYILRSGNKTYKITK